MNSSFTSAERDGVRFLECYPLRERGVPHGFTLRSETFDGRARLGEVFGVSEIAFMRQVHGSVVRTAVPGASPSLECDGLATDRRGLGLVVQTADCAPILLWASERNAVAAVHAGWRGSLAGVAAEAIELLRKAYGAKPEEIHAAIGPAIRLCCYEVGDEVIERFSARGRELSRISKPVDRGRRHLDLVEDNRLQLLGAGVPEGQIYDSGRCTHCERESFYSYRREGPGVGRLFGVIGVR